MIIIRPENKAILARALRDFGPTKQIDQAIEELSELIQILIKDRRHGFRSKTADVTGEIADCIIMLEQLIMIYDNREPVNKIIDFKCSRLLECLKKHRSV